MRLLQLATGPDELIDLHPNVTVVTGLDDEQRRDLATAITGLAHGTASGAPGLLEAHGVMFDLSSEMLALLDVDAPGLQPVVRLGDLPPRPPVSARERELQASEQALALLTERWSVAVDADARGRELLADAVAALDHAREAAAEAGVEVAGSGGSHEGLSAPVAHAVEERERIEAALSELQERRRSVAGRREAIAVTIEGARAAKLAAVARTADLTAALDQAALDRDVSAEAEVARAALLEVEGGAHTEPDIRTLDPRDDASTASIAEVEISEVELSWRREELERAVVAFESAPVADVQQALDAVRAASTAERVASPEAMEVAEQLDAVDAELGGLPDGDGLASRLVEARSRLGAARQALAEAEQAVRNPVLDRDAVDRLEVAHADLLDAIEKSDGRFAGARARRRVEELRVVEQQCLDELGFTSYADFMMGNSLLHVDPESEQALDDARAALSVAEDAERLLHGQTETERTRVALLDQRQVLLGRAQELVGRPVGATGAAEALRQMRVERTATPDQCRALRDALEASGLALADDELDLDDLLVLADTLLDEADMAARRAAAAREALEALDLDVAPLGDPPTTRGVDAITESPGVAKSEPLDRVADGRLKLEEAGAGLRAHHAAKESTPALTEALALAAAEERAADEAAAAAEEALAGARAADVPLVSEQLRLEAALAVATRKEAEARDQFAALLEGSVAHEARAVMSETERVHATAVASSAALGVSLAGLAAERARAEHDLEELRASAAAGEGGDDDGPIRDEVEWYLLARLASQRLGKLVGSVPLLIDNALQELKGFELEHLLNRLERMADTVQVIVVSEDPSVITWAIRAGEDRAAVVYPSRS